VKTKNVLAIDDEPYISHTLRNLFESDGFRRCIEPESGAVGIQLALEHPTDLIILDPSMPDMTGMQVAPILQKLFPAIPVIFTFRAETLSDTNLTPFRIWQVISKSGYSTISFAELTHLSG
jgi:DNA-binding response OmpR family regulator